jgi:hypothetical protein
MLVTTYTLDQSSSYIFVVIDHADVARFFSKLRPPTSLLFILKITVLNMEPWWNDS